MLYQRRIIGIAASHRTGAGSCNGCASVIFMSRLVTYVTPLGLGVLAVSTLSQAKDSGRAQGNDSAVKIQMSPWYYDFVA